MLCLCAEAGAIRLGVLSLDGVKVGANASLSTNRTLSRLRREIERMDAKMREQDARDAARFGSGVRGDELPDELRVRQNRLARLRLAYERLDLDLAAERVLLEASRKGESVGARGKRAVAVAESCGVEAEPKCLNADAGYWRQDAPYTGGFLPQSSQAVFVVEEEGLHRSERGARFRLRAGGFDMLRFPL